MSAVRTVVSWIGLALVACAPAPGTAPATPDIERKDTQVSNEKAASQAAPDPSDPIAVVLNDAQLVVRTDVEELRQTPLMRLLNASQMLSPELANTFETMRTRCGFQPINSLRSVVFSARLGADSRPFNIDTNNMVLGVTLDEGADQGLDCLNKLFDATQTTVVSGQQTRVLLPAVQGTASRHALNGGLLALSKPPLLLVGAESGLTTALAQLAGSGTSRNATLSQSLAATSDAILSVYFAADNPWGVQWAEAVWERSEIGYQFRLLAEFATHAQANAAQRQLGQSLKAAAKALSQEHKAAGAKQGQGEVLATLSESVEIGTEATRLRAELALPKAASEAALVEVLSTLIVRRMAARRVAAQYGHAKATLLLIARQLAAYAGRTEPHRFPASAPPVPSVVPRATSVTLTETDWRHASWRAIQFSLTSPTSYSFEFSTAPNGQSVVVRARGDLDGDGDYSVLELGGKIDSAGAIVLDDSIRETNPLE